MIMKMIHTLPKERQTKIHFDPTPHKYYDDGGLFYTSVTTLISAYKKPFNKKYWSMYVALRDAGFTVKPDMENNQFIIVDGIKRSLHELYNSPLNVFEVKTVIDEWKRLTDIACARGNKIHDSLENIINESKDDIKGETNHVITPSNSLQGELIIIRTKHELEKTGIQDRYPTIYLQLKNYVNNGCILYAEKRIYSTTFQIAGMIDVLIVKGNKFAILDWKTNKDELKFVSGYYKKIKLQDGNWVKTSTFIQTNDKLLAPVEDLPDCKGMVYSLQLSLYAYIMIRWGYKLVDNGLVICHIRPNEVPEFINIKYYGSHIENMLLHHYKRKVLNNETNVNHFGIV